MMGESESTEGLGGEKEALKPPNPPALKTRGPEELIIT